MVSIRHNIFETNSSSTHSIAMVLSKNNYSLDYLKYLNDKLCEDNYLHIKFRDFHGKTEYIYGIKDKIAFLLMLDFNQFAGWVYDENQLNEEDRNNYLCYMYEDSSIFKLIEGLCIDKIPNCKGIMIDKIEGSIDHQTIESYNYGEEFLDSYDVNLEDFLFNDNYLILADHD